MCPTSHGSPAAPEPRPEGYDPRDYPPVAVTVDIVLMTVVGRELKVLLVQRGEEPHRGEWALPGGFVKPAENLADAAARELCEETGIDPAPSLKQFRAYGAPDRDPRMRVVTVAYLAIVPRLESVPRGGSDAVYAELVPIKEVQTGKLPLAFDHLEIVGDALAELQSDLEMNALHFCGPEFTISELREMYEVIQKKQFDPGNFQRMVRRRELLMPTGGRSLPGDKGGRPATLWRSVRPSGPAADQLSAGKAADSEPQPAIHVARRVPRSPDSESAGPAAPLTRRAVRSEPESREVAKSHRSVEEILLNIEKLLGDLQESHRLEDPGS